MLTVSYSDLVADPRATVGRILRFGGLDCNDTALPEALDAKPAQKWKSVLTPAEQQVVRDHLDRHPTDYDELCNRAGADLLAGCSARLRAQVLGA